MFSNFHHDVIFEFEVYILISKLCFLLQLLLNYLLWILLHWIHRMWAVRYWFFGIWWTLLCGLVRGLLFASNPCIPKNNVYSLSVKYTFMTTCSSLSASYLSFLVASRVCLAFPVFWPFALFPSCHWFQNVKSKFWILLKTWIH